jgi:hypothetical protein
MEPLKIPREKYVYSKKNIGRYQDEEGLSMRIIMDITGAPRTRRAYQDTKTSSKKKGDMM